MRIVLATGIYPPDIGGPATYVEKLAEGLRGKGLEVTVLTYGKKKRRRGEDREEERSVMRVSKAGPGIRWIRYALALRKVAGDADIVYCFSSISCGVPMFLSHLHQPKRVLRLGGDFLWERYTDRGGDKSLEQWYEQGPWLRNAMNGLLKRFDYIVYSTPLQERIHERAYEQLPLHGVIENALPAGTPTLHQPHEPIKLLYFGRYVRFKNLFSIIEAMRVLPDATLTFVGEGPIESELKAAAADMADRITFRPSLHGEEKNRMFADHDLLVIPSYTDISPNAALEARAAGLPVLLTEQTGLSTALTDGCLLRELRTPQQIAAGVRDAVGIYPQLATRAAAPLPERGWEQVCDEHVSLFRGLL